MTTVMLAIDREAERGRRGGGIMPQGPNLIGVHKNYENFYHYILNILNLIILIISCQTANI